MKVLHLPTNIASQMSVAVRALREVGVEARGLALNANCIQDDTAIEDYRLSSRRKNPIRHAFETLGWRYAVRKAMRWADVIHWHYGTLSSPFELDLQYAARLGKPRIVQFWGSDIRIPEKASADNPYAVRMYRQNQDAGPRGGERSRQVQARYAQYGFHCLVPGYELGSYLQGDMFPSPYHCKVGLMLGEFEPKYPDPDNRRPLVVHAPSRKSLKGTEHVLAAVDSLKRSHDFDFRLIHNVPRREALATVRDCDVMLDQFVLGAHGFVTLEAMCFGKPALCYIKPSLAAKYPSDCPIVHANPDNLAEVLGRLLKDGRKRLQIGKKSRAYVQQHHDAHRLARQLSGIYDELLSRNGSSAARKRR